jgi:hypothetical protein
MGTQQSRFGEHHFSVSGQVLAGKGNRAPPHGRTGRTIGCIGLVRTSRQEPAGSTVYDTTTDCYEVLMRIIVMAMNMIMSVRRFL